MGRCGRIGGGVVSDNSKIEWTQKTWNPILGCDRISPGCDRCYAITQANIRAANPNPKIAKAFEGLTARTDAGLDWTGRVNLLPERLSQPLRWRKPATVFVNSLADLFHKDVPDDYIAQVFAVMAATLRHTYQLLTKRHGRMRSLLTSDGFLDAVGRHWMYDDRIPDESVWPGWPLPNVHLGVSAEDDHWARIRTDALVDTPAAVRFLSCEPLLGPIDLSRWMPPGRARWQCGGCRAFFGGDWQQFCPGCGREGYWCGSHTGNGRPNDQPLSWVIVGGESGSGARPMHPDWARSLRDQCQSSGVPYFFKQWGEWGPAPWRVDRKPGETDADYKERAEAVCATHSYPVWADRYGLEPLKADHKPWSLERTSLPPEQAGLRRWGKRREPDGGLLFHIGDVGRALWFAQGREATRAEVLASIDSGLPILREMAEQDGPEATAELERMHAAALEHVPAGPS